MSLCLPPPLDLPCSYSRLLQSIVHLESRSLPPALLRLGHLGRSPCSFLFLLLSYPAVPLFFVLLCTTGCVFLHVHCCVPHQVSVSLNASLFTLHLTHLSVHCENHVKKYVCSVKLSKTSSSLKSQTQVFSKTKTSVAKTLSTQYKL